MSRYVRNPAVWSEPTVGVSASLISPTGNKVLVTDDEHGYVDVIVGVKSISMDRGTFEALSDCVSSYQRSSRA